MNKTIEQINDNMNLFNNAEHYTTINGHDYRLIAIHTDRTYIAGDDIKVSLIIDGRYSRQESMILPASHTFNSLFH